MENKPSSIGLLLAVGVALVAYGAAVAPLGAQSETRCIQTNLINGTKRSGDETFIDFRMRNGTVYRNTLRSKCAGISSNAIGYRTHGSRELCKGGTVRVARTGNSCILGSFVEVSNP